MVDGQRLTFEVFGLRQEVLTMIDRETESLWTHLEGKALRGKLEDRRMPMLPLFHTTWGEWKKSHPHSRVLSSDTPFRHTYKTVQLGAFNQQESVIGDDRLPSNAMVVGVEIDGIYKGYPLKVLENSGGVINDVVAGEAIVVIYAGESMGGVAYSRSMNEQILEFYNSEDEGIGLRDRQSGSLWSFQAKALSGPLKGNYLKFVPSFVSEWYGWSAYHPETELFEAPDPEILFSHEESLQSCITLADTIKTLEISPSNVLAPQNAEFPKDSKILDISDIIEYSTNSTASVEINEKRIQCKGKVKLSLGNYPVEFYLMIENRIDFIVLESQGKRKWVIKWKAKD